MKTRQKWMMMLASELLCKNLDCSADENQSNGVVHFEGLVSVKPVPLCGQFPCCASVLHIVQL